MKVLVTAASKHGATAEIATVIGDVLATQSIEVDILPPDDVERVDAYDAVILGSGVYAGHWLKPAKAFIERNETALRERPVFLFSSGPIGEPPKESDEPAEARSADTSTGAIDHRVFGGRLTASQLGPFEKLVIRMVKAPLADDRAWDEIADWAREIAAFLREESGAPPAEKPRAEPAVAVPVA
jgi:menaquinone-dependent protoporphyrinogen oxidase